MSKWLAIISVVIIGAAVGAFYFNNQSRKTDNNKQETNMQPTPTPQPTPPQAAQEVPAKAMAKIETTEGTFEVALDGKAAPKTVANFIKLSKDGFYNGLK